MNIQQNHILNKVRFVVVLWVFVVVCFGGLLLLLLFLFLFFFLGGEDWRCLLGEWGFLWVFCNKKFPMPT